MGLLVSYLLPEKLEFKSTFSAVTSNEIYKLLMNMNTKKSTGYDNIPA